MNNKLKGAARSKTIRFALLLAFVEPILENFPLLKATLGEHYGLAFTVLAAIIGALRYVTNKSLDER